MAPKLDMIGIVVEDMGRTLAFYRELGFEFPDDAESKGHVEASLPGGLRVAWDTRAEIQSFDPDWTAATGGSGRIALAFLVESPHEVDATYERLTTLGHEGVRPPWDAFWGQRYASISDPDGNGIDIFCPLE
jgi:catechol 2,3-dioxygenase-like lactoylglutathione lyase family enzyme